MNTIPVTFSVDARAVGRMRSEIDVTAVEPASIGTFRLATDESPQHGGDGSAPTPLHLFTAALAGCFMTQVRSFAQKLRVRIDGLRVTGTAQWQAHTGARGTYVSEPMGVVLAAHVESAADLQALVDLLEAAAKGCFVEQSMSATMHVRHELHHEGEVIGIEVGR